MEAATFQKALTEGGVDHGDENSFRHEPEGKERGR
jgi:hypothetical protein